MFRFVLIWHILLSRLAFLVQLGLTTPFSKPHGTNVEAGNDTGKYRLFVQRKSAQNAQIDIRQLANRSFALIVVRTHKSYYLIVEIVRFNTLTCSSDC